MEIKQLFKDSFTNKKGEYLDEISSKEINILFEHKLLKAFLPNELNGLNCNIFQTLQLIEDAAYLNGSLGWLVQIGNGGNYFASNFNNETILNFFKDSQFVIAGSGTATCKAEKKEKGVFIEYGTWKYCSGSAYASHFTLTFDLEGETVSAIVNKNDVNVIYDWNTIGMKNTSTNSIEVNQLFIPNENLFHVSIQKNYTNIPIFGLPFLIYAQGFFIHVLYGIIKRMTEESNDIKHLQSIEKMKEESNQIINICLKNKTLSEEEQLKFQSLYKLQAEELQTIATTIFKKNGMASVYKENIISTFYMDLITLCQHKLLQQV